jgi:hypothetical protein
MIRYNERLDQDITDLAETPLGVYRDRISRYSFDRLAIEYTKVKRYLDLCYVRQVPLVKARIRVARSVYLSKKNKEGQ